MIKLKAMGISNDNKVVDIELLLPNDYNPKPDYETTEELQLEFQKIKDSLAYHGQIDPVIVRELNGKFEIINGYHRWLAMKELGYKEIEVKNLGGISREEAIKKTLSFEELQIPLDRIEVAKLIVALEADGKSLEGLPYSSDEVDKLREMLNYDWSQLGLATEVSFDEVETKKVIKVDEATYLKFMAEAEVDDGINISILKKISFNITDAQTKVLEDILKWGQDEYGTNKKGDIVMKMLEEARKGRE